MGRVIPESNTCELHVTLVATRNDDSIVEVGSIITINKVIKLTMLPDIYFNKPSKMDKEYPSIDYASRPDLYRIKGQQYLGTVSSLITDNLIDVYLFKRKYMDTDNVEKDETFLLLIPSLVILDSVETIDIIDRPYRMTGMISMVRVDDRHTKGGRVGYITTDSTNRVSISSYLSDEDIVIDETKLVMTGIALSGMSQFDNMISSLETKSPDTKHTFRSNRIGLSQFLILGTYDEMFPNDEKLSLDIARIEPTNTNTYEIGNTNFIPVGSRTRLVLPLDI